MNTPLNDDTRQKSRELARTITVAHDLDPEIQEELYGHIEDKLLAYMNGEERVSNEDAFILVREHFGDAKVIRGLLQEVHAGAVQVSLFRRILALVTVTAALQSIGTLIRSVLVVALALGGYFEGQRDDVVLTLAMALAMFSVLYWQLRRWKKSEVAGENPWYARWTMPRLVTCFSIALLMTWLIPTVSLATAEVAAGQRYVYNVVAGIMVLSALMSFCLIWLWWTDAAARGPANNVALGWLWALFIFATSIYPAKSFIALGDYDIPVGSSTFAHGQWGDVSITAFLAYGGHWESISNLIASVLAGAIFALVGCSVAACWHKLRQWQQSHANKSIAQL